MSSSSGYCRRRRLGFLALLWWWSSLLGSILLGAAVTISASTTTSSNNKQSVESPKAKLKVALKQDSLERVPSCQHTIAQVELTNTHPTDFITIRSIQTTPEETFLIRYDPSKQQSEAPPSTTTTTDDEDVKEEQEQQEETEESATYNTGSWDQSSIPQQVHISRLPNNSKDKTNHGFILGPGEVAVVPITFLPRYPCTLGGDRNDDSINGGLEDYYAPYQVAYSSSWDPDDENFSLAQPDPPKLYKYVSGTARADWEQLLREMPPQERSNWQEQLRKHYDGNSSEDEEEEELPMNLPPEFQNLIFEKRQIISGSGSGGDGSANEEEQWIFEVQTTLIVDTDRGTVQLPVEASSLRQNEYGLPDVIYFDQDDIDIGGSTTAADLKNDTASSNKTKEQRRNESKGDDDDDDDGSVSPQPSRQGGSTGKKTSGVLWLDTDLEDNGEEPPEVDEDESPKTYRDCYNVIMTNPSLTEDLEVVEVFLTRPDRMNLQVQGDLSAPSSSIREWWNAPRSSDEMDSRYGHGSLLFEPGEQKYVVTVCTSRSSTPATSRDAPFDWLYGKDDLDEDVPLALDGPESYVVARAQRAAARAAKAAAAAKHSLGFLQIRTDKGDTLFVALEKDRQKCRVGASGTGEGFRGRGGTPGELTPSAAPLSIDFDRRQQAYPPSYHHALYMTHEVPTAEQAAKMEKPVMDRKPPPSPLTASSLKALPPRLDFSLLSSSSPTVVSHLAIRNPQDYQLKIMRSGVAVEIEDDVDPDLPNPEELGLHMSVKILNPMLEASTRTEESLMITCSINWDKFQSHKLESMFFHGNVILRATAHIDYSYQQWIKNLVNTNAKRQQGKILIKNDYADPSNESYKENKQTEFVLEVPMTVSMVEGKIGIMIHRTSHPFPHLWAVRSWKEGLGSVSSIFYPQRTFDIRAELDSGDGPVSEPIFSHSGIEHKLRIFSNIHTPSRGSSDADFQPQLIEIDTATVHGIEDEDGDNHYDSEAKSRYIEEQEDVCRRFSIEIGPPPEEGFPFEGFNDVGLVHIQYRFPLPEDGDDSSDFDEKIEYNSIPAFPKHCYLSITTKPYTELHRIPLIVYPGHTDITATQSPALANHTDFDEGVSGKYTKKNKRRKNQKNIMFESREEYSDGHAVVGFDGLLNWFRTTSVGASLKIFLERIEGGQWEWGWHKRGQHNEEKLLGQYVTSLCRKSLNVRNAHLRPVLLKVGAIKHGGTESSSFYMTNHNPIPLLVSIDVGEVEGMSISLARVPTRGRGDGNNILDHFPKKKNIMSGYMGPYSHLVPSGEYRGHPIAGLRKFLQHTDIAQQFFSVFRFRDAITRSSCAVERQPLLSTLYKKYAFGEFHRDPLPMRFGRDSWSQCRERKDPSEPSQYYEPNSTTSDEDFEEGIFDDGYIERVKAGKLRPGPLILSDDLAVSKPLKVCWDKDAAPMNYPSDGTYIIVPPGGVARFEVKVNSPPKTMLKDDITRFLSTGLVLSTDHGEILPILVTFEALLGELHVEATNSTPNQSSNKESRKSDCVQTSKQTDQPRADTLNNMTLIRVPASLFQGKLQGYLNDDNETQKVEESLITTSADSSIPTSEGQSGITSMAAASGSSSSSKEGISLSVKSSFSRDVRLLEVSSCNPWFEVQLGRSNGSFPVLHHHPSHLEKGLPFGIITSNVKCDTGYNLTTLRQFPSFYQCALNWLSNRAAIQPRGCGLSPTVHKDASDDSGLAKVAEHSGIKRSVKAFEKALVVSSFAFDGARGVDELPTGSIENGTFPTALRRKTDGLIAPVVLDVFAEAWDAWRVVADFGMRVLSSTLKATIEYDSMKGVPSNQSHVQNLMVSMRDMAVETVLSAPKLFDCKRAQTKNNILTAVTNEDEGPSLVEFASTLVADTRSVMIPLRNPTSVPIRVRLAAAAPISAENKGNKSEAEKDTLKTKFGVNDEIRSAFTEHADPPFVQSNKLNATIQNYQAGVEAEQLWWDGAGGYYLADEYGDVIRSHHNVRIMANAGVHVSLANPSLHSTSAVIVGCGVRCGVRDDKQGTQSSKKDDESEESKVTSPLGAAAAVGVTLAGRTRSSLPQANVRVMDEPSFSAGAASFGGSGGPSAFAIPYSALDEIIIPPYGEVEVGPILFRPPGRHSIHGCQLQAESRAITMTGAVDKSKACSTSSYQSMVYLENSLTGLERIALRGKALWERVIFMDPPVLDPIFDEDYGDIELRNGRSALVFSGSKEVPGSRDERRHYLPRSSVSGSVVKEVLVYNEGDTVVDFSNAYLSDSSRLHRKQSTSLGISEFDDPCSYKQFRLVNCWDDETDGDSTLSEDRDQIFRNVKNGFQLEPGQNISLFIEHFPDCSRPQQFIALNLERRRNKFSRASGKLGLQMGGQTQGQRNSFRHRKLDLLLGYDMTDAELKACAPVRHWGFNIQDAQCKHPSKCKNRWVASFGGRFLRLGWSLLWFSLMVAFLSLLSVVIFSLFVVRKQSSDVFSAALTARRKTTGEGTSTDKTATQPVSGRGNWGAAFRCLARADPSSSDLQTLGREQIRHVVLGRYRSMGILSPQCFNSHGVFIRERGTTSNTSPSRQIAGKEGNVGGNDRIRTLSDAMYRNFSSHQHEHIQAGLPCGLAWRAAAARGLSIPEIVDKPPNSLKTSQLLLSRVAGAKASHTQDDNGEGYDAEDQGHESSEGTEPEEDSSEEDDEEQYTEDGEEEEESEELQESFQSEVGEEQPPEISDNIDERHSQPLCSTGSDVAAEVMESEPKKTQSDDGGSNRGNVSSRSSFSTEESVYSDVKAPGEPKQAPQTAKPVSKPTILTKPPEKPPKPDTKKLQEQGTKTEKKNDGKIAPGKQEPKNDKRGRQKPTGATPSRAKSGESSKDNTQVQGPVAKPNQGKDTKAKKNETPKPPARQPKAKIAAADKGKQTESKQNQARDKSKAKTTSGALKGAEADDGKPAKKRGKKADNASSGGKKSKDDSANKASGDGKAKASSTQEKKKKGKKGKAAKKDSPALPKENKGDDPQLSTNNAEARVETILRPPPGLAPPPGFGQGGATTAQSGILPRTSFDAQLLPPSAFLSDASILGSPSSTLGTPSRGTTAFGGLSPSLLNVSGDSSGLAGPNIGTPLRGSLPLGSPAQQQASGEALLASVTSTPMNAGTIDDVPSQANNSMAGFDVMDFLDSILNEGSNTPQAPSPQAPQSTFLQVSAAAVPPLSSDPWATERQSRALAYGIDIDDAGSTKDSSGANRSESDDAAGINMPLLSTAAIRYSDRGDNESNDDGDDDDEDDNGDSFYASLLGGHQQNRDDDDNYSGRD